MNSKNKKAEADNFNYWNSEERIKKMIEHNKFKEGLRNPLISELSDRDFIDVAVSCSWYIQHFETKFKMSIDKFYIGYEFLNGHKIFVKENIKSVKNSSHPTIVFLYSEKDVEMTLMDLKIKTLRAVKKMIEHNIEDVRKFDWDKEISKFKSIWAKSMVDIKT